VTSRSTDSYEQRGRFALTRFLRRRSRILDTAIGLLLPPVLLFFDPIVFRDGWATSGSYLGAVKAGSYVATGFFVAVLAWWLASRRAAAFCGAVLSIGCAFALLLGLALLPLSLIGSLALGLGLLGLAPFAMAYVYGNRAGEAWEIARTSGTTSWRSALAGFALPLLLAGGVQLGMNRLLAHALEQVRSEDSGVREHGLARLSCTRWLWDPAQLAKAFEQELDPERKERLADAYLALTGMPIESLFLD
jgi:hypothetical protein